MPSRKSNGFCNLRRKPLSSKSALKCKQEEFNLRHRLALNMMAQNSHEKEGLGWDALSQTSNELQT